MTPFTNGIELVGDGLPVPCADGAERPYLNLDAAASTSALPPVAARVAEFLPWYSSIRGGAGYKSQVATAAYEQAHEELRCFARRDGTDDAAIICRNATDAISHLAYRLHLEPTDVVATTVLEHHANLLPWGRVTSRRFVECERDGTFEAGAVRAALETGPRPRLLALTGASNVTGWLPPLEEIIESAHERCVPVLVDAAQLAPHRALPAAADFLAFSGHKMYAPYGAGALIGPRSAFADGDPLLAAGGDLVDLDEVVWTVPPEREEAGSPNVVGAVALAAATRELVNIGWKRIAEHDAMLSRRLRTGLASIPGVRLLGPELAAETLPIATFVVDGVPHSLVAARLSAEFAIGVRHGSFSAHPYLIRLLGLSDDELRRSRSAARNHDRRSLPGAVRASACISTTIGDIERFLDAVREVASTAPAVEYLPDPATGEYWPRDHSRPDGSLKSLTGWTPGQLRRDQRLRDRAGLP